MKLTKTKNVEAVFDAYPKTVQSQMKALRKLVLEVAKASDNIQELEETLKWGEPSYLAKKGSTIRMDWKASKPEQYAIYFKCTSKLVETFRAVYGDTFNYEKNRAIVFKLNDELPKPELKHCIKLALHYHYLKHLPYLGAKENTENEK